MKRAMSIEVGLGVLPLAGLLIMLRAFLSYALVAPVSFDGAMNLNTAASLAAGTGYGFFYDTFFPFPAQTDGPFVVPAALLIRLFGVSPLVTQAVNLAYFLALLPLLTALLMRLGLPLWLALLGTLAAVSVPGFAEYAMNGYGEVPAFVWYVAGLLTLGAVFSPRSARRAAFAAGALFALAYLTKVVALLLVAPPVAVALWLTYRRQLPCITLVHLALGILVPILLWEAFRLASIGSFSGYSEWWRLQLDQVLQQSGAGEGFAGLAGKAKANFDALRSMTGLNTYLLLAFVSLPVVLFVPVQRNLAREARFILLSLLLSGALYFCWWLLLTPTAMTWLRRIMNGLLLHELAIFALAFHVLASERARRETSAWRTAAVLSATAMVVLPALALARNGESITKPPRPAQYVPMFFELADLLRDLPRDAVIFGTAWWQSPGLALYSGRKIHNFQRWTPDEINRYPGGKYLVFDNYALAIAKGEVAGALALVDSTEIFRSDGGELHRIDSARYYAALEISSADIERLRSAMDFSVGDYEFKRGFYQIEGGGHAWMRTDGLVVLARTGERRLVLSLLVPDQLVKDQPVGLRVEVPGCAEQTFSLSKPWDNVVELALKCPPSEEKTPVHVFLHVDRHVPFVNQIDADNRLLALLVRSVKLID
jgi:hypothetical protein